MRAEEGEPIVRMMLAAATGLPTILLTAALVVAVCFWGLVAAGLASATGFDTDVDLRAWGLGGVPVAVALSSLTALAWSMSVGGRLVLFLLVPPGPATGLLHVPVPLLALLTAWRLTRRVVRSLHRPAPAGSDRTPPPARSRDLSCDGTNRAA